MRTGNISLFITDDNEVVCYTSEKPHFIFNIFFRANVEDLNIKSMKAEFLQL